MNFRSDSQRKAMFANIFGKNVFSNDKFKGMFKNEYGDRVVVKNLPIEQMYHLRGSYGIGGGKRHFGTSDSSFYKFDREKRKLYGSDLYYDIDKKELFEAFVRKKEQELRDEGRVVMPSKIRADVERGYGYDVWIPYRYTANDFEAEKEKVMRPFNTTDMSGDYKVPIDDGDFEDHESDEYKEYISSKYDRASGVYVDNLAESIDKREEKVPIVVVDKYDVKRGELGEGRHRILAMEQLGYKEMPVAVEVIDGEPVMSKDPELVERVKAVTEASPTYEGVGYILDDGEMISITKAENLGDYYGKDHSNIFREMGYDKWDPNARADFAEQTDSIPVRIRQGEGPEPGFANVVLFDKPNEKQMDALAGQFRNKEVYVELAGTRKNLVMEPFDSDKVKTFKKFIDEGFDDV